MTLRKRWGSVGAIVGVLALAGSGLGVGLSAASATTSSVRVHHAVRPHGARRLEGRTRTATGAVVAWSNQMNANSNGWCTYAGGATGQCDGNADTEYGTIDGGLPSHFTNYGGYAVSAPAPTHTPAVTAYGRASGYQDSPLTGCPEPGGENCAGPYFLGGGANAPETIFPNYGMSTSIELYVDPVWAAANPGQVVDWDVALNASTPTTYYNYFEDFAFNLCTTAAGGGGFYVSNSNGAGGCSTGPDELTTAGWYTFHHDFWWNSTADELWVGYTITGPGGTLVLPTQAVNTDPYAVNTALAKSELGGVDYGWFPDEDILGLPVAAASIAPNTVSTPHPAAP